MTAFTQGFGPAVTYAPQKFPVLVEFVPVSLDITRKDTFTDIEIANNLLKGSILGARWICEPKKRDPAQRHAHLVVKCSSKDTANEWIANPKILASKEVESAKYIHEPLQCHNCQLDGHTATQCISLAVCGACSKNHRTHTYTDHRSFFCSSCKSEGHPTWFCTCLNFMTQQIAHSDQVPDNKYRYYITSKDWTWELLTNNTCHRSSHPPCKRRVDTATGLMPCPYQQTNQECSHPQPIHDQTT
jgi:hypothetical protein